MDNDQFSEEEKFSDDPGENLRMQNDFLKMKMMAESGALFGGVGGLPPEIENQFLKSIMEFEKMNASSKPKNTFEVQNGANSDEVLSLAKKLWDYHHINHKIEKSDCILALGSHDLRVAERTAELYLQGWAPLVIMSGGLGNFTKEIWTQKEADKFAAIALQKGVPAEAILIENNSTNTGENILFTQKLLKEKGLNPQSFIVVQKPYMERRAYATFKKHWPDKKLIVTSPQISFEEYPTEEIPMERVIHIMVGDLQRIKMYPEKGYQIFQEIPEEIRNAYEKLITLGFTKHLMK